VSIYVINYLSQSFMIAYLPFNQPAVIALDKYGLKYGVVIGTVLTTIGLWMKCLINESFVWVVIGQTIIAIGQPFLLNACSKVSANWFPENERLAATAIGANSYMLGVSIGLFLPSLFVQDNLHASDDTIRSQVLHLGLLMASLATLTLIPVVLTFKSAPDSVTIGSSQVLAQRAN
jgi:MFS transporter, FLVCR family, feline leukemia virus subgroup C receptor-related protein